MPRLEPGENEVRGTAPQLEMLQTRSGSSAALAHAYVRRRRRPTGTTPVRGRRFEASPLADLVFQPPISGDELLVGIFPERPGEVHDS